MAVSVQQELSISSMDPVSSFNSPPNQKRARPQLKLDTNQDKPEEKKILIRQNSINSYVVENHPIATDISKSASPSKTSSKNFFNIFLGQENNDEHSFVGPYYYVLQRSNGKEMQDRYKASVFSKDKAYFGVFDGHSSQIIPELAAQKLDQYFLEYMKTQNEIPSALRSAFNQIEEEAIRYLKEKNARGGTTAISVVVHKDYLCVCNLGDCQAVLFQKDNYKCLSSIHDYHNEHERHAVEQRGGIILKNRLEGEMALTRSIGDFKYKKFMSSEPEIVEHQITEQDKYLIIASDGVWNGITPQTVLTRLKEFETKNMFKGVSLKFIGDCLLHEASNNIKTKKDNMSLIVISIKEYMSGL